MKTIQDPEVFRRRSMNFGALKRIMKKCVQILITFGAMILLGSCIFPDPLGPPVEPWLCSINADGTGFRKIKKVDLSFGTTGFWDIYMTKDNRIIFYGEKLWISDPDTIDVLQITPHNLSVFNKPQLEFSKDGVTAYFAASRDLYKINLSNNELSQITNTPVNYHYAEPVLSDDESCLTLRSYSYKSKEPRTVGVYINLIDYALNYVYSEIWFPASYKTKIMNGMNCQIQENKNGFASVSLLDSTYILHLPYKASYKNMLETSSDQRFILSRYVSLSPSNATAIAIDLNDYSLHEMGSIYEHIDSNPIKACKDTNLVYIRDMDHLYKYDLETHNKSLVFGSTNRIYVYRILMHTPTWDGSKVYFYAEIAEK